MSSQTKKTRRKVTSSADEVGNNISNEKTPSPTVRFEDIHYSPVSSSIEQHSPFSKYEQEQEQERAAVHSSSAASALQSQPPSLPLSAVEMSNMQFMGKANATTPSPMTPTKMAPGNDQPPLIPSILSFHCRKFEQGIDDLFTMNQFERSLKSLVKTPFEKNILKYFQIVKKLFPVVIVSPRRDWKNKGLPKLLTIFPKPSSDTNIGGKKGANDQSDAAHGGQSQQRNEENDEENEQEGDEEDQQHQEEKQDHRDKGKDSRKRRGSQAVSISPSPSFQSFFSETVDDAHDAAMKKNKKQIRVYDRLSDVPPSILDKSKISSQTKSSNAVVKRIHQMNHEARQQLVTMKMNRRFSHEPVDTEDFYVQGNGMQVDSVRYHASQDFIATFAISKDGRFYGYVTLHGKLEVFESRRNSLDSLVISKQLEEYENTSTANSQARDCFDDERDPKVFPYPTALTLYSMKETCFAIVADSTGEIHVHTNEARVITALSNVLHFGDILLTDGCGLLSAAESQSSARRPSDADSLQDTLKLVFDWVTAITTCKLHRVVIGTNNGLVYLWNRKTNACRKGKIFSLGNNSNGISLNKTISCLEYCARRDIVICGCHDNTARIWTLSPAVRLTNGESQEENDKIEKEDCHLELILTLRGHQDIVNTVAITSSGHIAYTGSRDKTVIVWDAIMGKPLRVIADLPSWSPLWTQTATNAADRENHIIKSLYLSHDEYLLTVVMQGGLVVFLDAIVTEQVKKLSLSSLDRKVCSIALSASVSMSEDQLLAQSHQARSQSLSEEAMDVLKTNSIAVVSGHKSLWVINQLDQSTVMFIDNLKAAYKKLLKASQSPVISEFSTEGSGIYSTVNLTGTTIVTALGNAICVFKQLDSLQTFSDLQRILSQDVISLDDNAPTSMTMKHRVKIGVITCLLRICCIAILSTEDYIFVGDAKGKVALWSMSDGQGKLIFNAHSDVVNTIAIANRSLQLASGSDDTGIMFWKLKDNISLLSVENTLTDAMGVSSSASVAAIEEELNWEWSTLHYHTEAVNAITFSKDDKFVFTASDDKRIVIWDSITHKRIRVLLASEGPIRCMSLCSSLPIVVAGCRTSSSIVWNWQTGQELRVIGGVNDKVQLKYTTDARTITSIAISDDGMFVYTGGDDKSIRIHTELLANDFTRVSGHPKRSIANIGIQTGGSSRFSANKSRTAFLPICGQQMVNYLEQTTTIPLDAYSIVTAENNTHGNLLVTNRDFLREFILFDQFKLTSTGQTVLEFLATSRDTSSMLRQLLFAVPHAILHGPRDSSLLEAAFTFNIVSNSGIDNEGGEVMKKDSTHTVMEMSIINDEADSDDDLSISHGHVPKRHIVASNSRSCTALTSWCHRRDPNSRPGLSTSKCEIIPSWLKCWGSDDEKQDNEGDTEVVEVILEFYAHLLRFPTTPMPELRVEEDWVAQSCRKTFASYLTEPNVEDYLKNAIHPSDLISIEDICAIGSTWPHLFSQFVKSLGPVPNYEYTIEPTSTVRNMNKDFIYGCSKERSPVYYWVKAPNTEHPILNERNEWKYRNSLSVDAYWKLFGDNSLPVAVDPYLIPIKGIASKNSDFLAMVVEVANNTKDYAIFDNIVVRLLIKYKWSTYIGIRFTRDFAFLCIWFALYMFNTLSFQDFIAAKPNQDGDEDISSLSGNMILMGVIFLFVVYFFYHEMLQLVPLGGQSHASPRKSSTEESTSHAESLRRPELKGKHWITQFMDDLSDYLTDMSNWFNIVSYGLVTLSLSLQARLYYLKTMYYLHHDSKTEGDFIMDPADMHRIRTVAAANLPLLVLNVMYYLGGFSATGPFIRKLVGIFWGISTFLFLVALLILTFAGSFMLLLEHDSYPAELLSVYGFLFGDFDMGAMYEAPTNPTLAVTLLALFLFIMCIVLLNLLIAIMDDIKGNIDSRIDAETFYAKAKFILDYERTLIDATSSSIRHHIDEVKQCRFVVGNLLCYLWKTCSLLCCWDVITDQNEEIWFPTWIHLLAKADHNFSSCPDPFDPNDNSSGDGEGETASSANSGANQKTKNMHKTIEQMERKIEVLQKMVETMMDNTIVRWETNPVGTASQPSAGYRVVKIPISSLQGSSSNLPTQSQHGHHGGTKKKDKNSKDHKKGWFW